MPEHLTDRVKCLLELAINTKDIAEKQKILLKILAIMEAIDK